MTQLYRAANKLIKTLYVARRAMQAGDDIKAILSYNEVASVFFDKKGSKMIDIDRVDNKNIGICYNNIGCIHAK